MRNLLVSADVELMASPGRVHGVQVGDEYGVFPMESSEYFLSISETKIIVKFAQIDSLTAADPSLSLSQVKSGWKARPRTQIPIRRIGVRLGTTTSIRRNG